MMVDSSSVNEVLSLQDSVSPCETDKKFPCLTLEFPMTKRVILLLPVTNGHVVTGKQPVGAQSYIVYLLPFFPILR